MKPLHCMLGLQIVWIASASGASELSGVRRDLSHGDFVVVTEDGELNGFDSCGERLWRTRLGRTLINATEFSENGSFLTPRMVPAIDGSLYVVFPPDLTSSNIRIAHVNATIMSVVAESPFSTPAFPNTYLTGSKIQTLESVVFSEKFDGWMNEGLARHLYGRRLMFSINDWTLKSIDVSAQTHLWSLSFSELPPLTHAHLIPGSLEQHQVTSLARDIEIVTSADSNQVILRSRPGSCPDRSRRKVEFLSQVLGVYALLSPADTKGNLALVLVSKNSPIPTHFGGVPEGLFFNQLASQSLHSLPGIRVEYTDENPSSNRDNDGASFPLVVRPKTYEIMSREYHYSDEYVKAQVLSQYKLVDFLGFKFSQLSSLMKVYVVLVTIFAIYLSRRIYNWVSVRFVRASRKPTPSMTILLPDGTSLRQSIPASEGGAATISISSPTSTSSGARLVLIPSEATQPYEVVKVGQSDTVEFGKWQTEVDVEIFDKKIKDISQRTAKLPFAHSAASRRPSLESGNATVLLLGRNVDEPKLVFRNPRAESELQRPNIPIFTQSIRNAVASSALRESPSLRAYVPRAVCGSWNTFDGIFQEYVPKPKSVSVQSFKEYPESAVDTAFLVMLLRDTDAHDGNYTRDLRRKIALFDLGCALADRPLPNDAIDRLALDNFEIWKRVPYLLNVAFDQRHSDYIHAIDFAALKSMWQRFEYQDQLVEAARETSSRLVHPTVMLRILEMHARFLVACAQRGRTLLFAAEVLFSGTYDDVWLQVGELNIDALEQTLISLAMSEKSESQVFPYIDQLAQAPPPIEPDGELEL